MKVVVGFFGLLVIIAIGTFYYYTFYNVEPVSHFRTAPVVHGDLSWTISATGSVEPEDVVDIGAQVTGKIAAFGPDPRSTTDPKFKGKTVDFSSPVDEGSLLVQIDDSLYKAQYDQAKAVMAHDQANLGALYAIRNQATQEFKRAKELLPQNAIAQTDYDTDEANYKAAEANVEVGKAQILVSTAAAKLAETNLNYCTIRSPVNGVIISRGVNIGQTVVSAMSVTSMFLIAKDLKRLQVWALVNEADMGQIHEGLSVSFTVDALPGETFHGTVWQIRLNATSTSNVVTYTVVVATDNSDMKLLPYLTANLQFKVENRSGVLQVPNAALRWKPRPAQIAPDARKAALAPPDKKSKVGPPAKEGDQQAEATNDQEALKEAAKEKGREVARKAVEDRVKNNAGRLAALSGKDAETIAKEQSAKGSAGDGKAVAVLPAKAEQQRQQIWVKDGGYVRPIRVRTGITDGSNTEIISKKVEEAMAQGGMEVVVGENVNADSDDDTTNPFAPKIFKGGAPKAPPKAGP
jgi:HlyD family secretion protein